MHSNIPEHNKFAQFTKPFIRTPNVYITHGANSTQITVASGYISEIQKQDTIHIKIIYAALDNLFLMQYRNCLDQHLRYAGIAAIFILQQ